MTKKAIEILKRATKELQQELPNANKVQHKEIKRAIIDLQVMVINHEQNKNAINKG